jgi:hypothetical protein
LIEILKGHFHNLSPHDLVIETLSELRTYAKSLGVNWDELEYRSSLPKETVTEPLYGRVVETYSTKETPDKKEFGFVEDGTFFHFNNGKEFCCKGSDYPMLGEKETRCPKRGDKLLYSKTDGRKGPKAAWWAFVDTYEKALKDVENRCEYRICRPGTGTVAWKGKDLDKMRTFYPSNFPLEGYVIEKLVDGKWVETIDPR